MKYIMNYRSLILCIICCLHMSITFAGQCFSRQTETPQDAPFNIKQFFFDAQYIDSPHLRDVVTYIKDDTLLLDDFLAAKATDHLNGSPKEEYKEMNRAISLNRVEYASDSPKQYTVNIANATKANNMFGRCLEFSCVSALDMQSFPEKFPGYKVYTVGLEGKFNHRFVLLSKTNYSVDDRIPWSMEHRTKDSYIIDLWRAAITNEVDGNLNASIEFLFAPAWLHYYGYDSAIIRAQVWP